MGTRGQGGGQEGRGQRADAAFDNIPRIMKKATVLLVLLAVSALVESATLENFRFRTVGPATMSGRIVDIAVVESNTYTYYVASATGGLWKTTDNGTTFTQVFTRDAGPSLGCVTVSPSNP